MHLHILLQWFKIVIYFLTINQRMETSMTTLMAFFDTNKDHPEAHHLLYVEFPEQYVWVTMSKKWRSCCHDLIILISD